MSPGSEILIVGAGIVGLSLALELRLRGHGVAVVERGIPLAQASTAAAGMLALEDPYNPPGLLPLARLSASLYAGLLARVEALSSLAVPFQTKCTVQTMPDGTVRRLAERSVDPRQLAPALLEAAMNAGVRVIESRPWCSDCDSISEMLRPRAMVYTTGAWGWNGMPVFPRKGQMLRVRLPRDLALREVYRSEHVYVVPRTKGPQTGTALIGATVEDAGFDTSTTAAALADLRKRAAALVPELGREEHAPLVESWAGLRPATADGLPILGRLPSQRERAFPQQFIATGHFRNGILLAPATAVVMADLIEGRAPALKLEAFAPSRFAGVEAPVPVPAAPR